MTPFSFGEVLVTIFTVPSLPNNLR